MYSLECPQSPASDLMFPRKSLPLKIINLRRMSQEKHVKRMKIALQQRQMESKNDINLIFSPSTPSLRSTNFKSPFTIKTNSHNREDGTNYSLLEDINSARNKSGKGNVSLKSIHSDINHGSNISEFVYILNECVKTPRKSKSHQIISSHKNSLDLLGKETGDKLRRAKITESQNESNSKVSSYFVPDGTDCSEMDLMYEICWSGIESPIIDHDSAKVLLKAKKISKGKQDFSFSQNSTGQSNAPALKDQETTFRVKKTTSTPSKIPLLIPQFKQGYVRKRDACVTPLAKYILPEGINSNTETAVPNISENNISETLKDVSNLEKQTKLLEIQDKQSLSPVYAAADEICNSSSSLQSCEDRRDAKQYFDKVSPLISWLNDLECNDKLDKNAFGHSNLISKGSNEEKPVANTKRSGSNTNNDKSKETDKLSLKSDTTYIKCNRKGIDYNTNLDDFNEDIFKTDDVVDVYEWKESDEDYLSAAYSDSDSEAVTFPAATHYNGTPYNLRFPRSWPKDSKRVFGMDDGVMDDSLDRLKNHDGEQISSKIPKLRRPKPKRKKKGTKAAPGKKE